MPLNLCYLDAGKLRRKARDRMQRFVLIISLVWLVTGCNNSQPTPTAKSLDNPKRNLDQEASESDHQAKVYTTRMVELRDQALSYESAMKFEEAADVWRQIEHQVSSDFGENSWQAINAKIAHKNALRHAELMANYSAELNQMAVHQKQIKSAFANKQYAQALEQSQRLLNLQEPLFGDVSTVTARLKLQIGTLQQKLGQYEAALKNLHSGIEILRAKGIELHPELEVALSGLADIYSTQQKFRPAVANQKAATQLSGHMWGTDSLQYANQANQLGVIFHRAGNHDVAVNILNTAKEIRKNKLGAESLEYAHSCLNMGVALIAQQKLEEAQQQLSQARSIFGEKLGMANDYAVRCNAQLSTVTMLQNRPELAETLLQEIVDAGGESIPSSQLADYKFKLAIAQARQGKYKSAEPMLNEVLRRQHQIHGADSAQVSKTLNALAKVYQATHQKSKLDSVRKQLNQINRVASGNDFQPRY